MKPESPAPVLSDSYWSGLVRPVMRNEEMNAVVAQPIESRATPSANPMEMLQIAIQQGADLAKLEKLMDLEERWQAARAKQAYVTAFAAFKRNAPDVVKDMLNKQYGSDYSSLANLVNTVNKSLGEYGLNARWAIDQSNGITVDCVLSHVEGHSEKVTLSGPPDNSGQKNALQQIKSTLTYLEGATFQAVTGVVARSACADDDGNGATKKQKEEPKPPDGYVEWSDNLRAVVDEGRERLLEVWKASPMPMRAFMTKHEGERWNEMKKLADKASKTTAGAA